MADPSIAIARLTIANGLRQPITWLCTTLALILLGLSVLFGMFNFVEEDRMRLLLTAGVAISVFNGLFLGVVGASSAVHDELASRTALTLFAKPMGRGSFLFGKALGCWAVAATSCAILAIVHLMAVAFVNEFGFDFIERRPGAHQHQGQVVQWVPYGRLIAGHVLALANTAVMTAVASALALRLPLAANVIACFAIFVLAHLLAGTGMATTLAGALPALALFNIDESLQFQDLKLNGAYFMLCLGYAALYSLGSLLIGLALFKRQDIP